MLRKLIFPSIFLIFQLVVDPSILKAAVLSCPERLNRLALQSIIEGKTCEDCEKNLIAALKEGSDVATVMANWVSSEAISIQNFNGMQISANEAGVEILSNLSSQMAFSNSPSDSRLLTTFVFRGNKKQLVKFFKNVSDQVKGLANFEVLDIFSKQLPIEVASITSESPDEREAVLKASLQESQSKIILMNDSETQSFVALVGENTFRELNTPDRRVVSVGLASLAKTWSRNSLDVQRGNRFIRLKSDTTQVAYLISLNDLSLLQTERAILRAQLGETATFAEGNSESTGGGKVVTLSASDFTKRRGLIFKKNKFTLDSETPAFVISSYQVPSFVAFYPQYLKRASEAEILSSYKALGQISPDEKVPRGIVNFFSSYKFGQTKANAYLDYSLSDLNGNEGFKNLEKGIKKKKPIIATQLRSAGTDDAMILIPVLRK